MNARPPIAVVALGGNALVRRGERGEIRQQRHHVRESVLHLPLLLERGYALVVTHGNGPAVGHLLLQGEAAKDEVPPLPLDVCDADTEGGIGYLIQQTLGNVLEGAGLQRKVVSLVTQVLVDPEDPAFAAPAKPVGPFYSRDEVDKLRENRGWSLEEDAGRGYRRMVASPRPIEILEAGAIELLLRHGTTVIAAGGGGIPVRRDENGALRGIEAVIDKDRSSSLLGRRIGAKLLVILTAEESVYRNFGRPDQVRIPAMDVARARDLLRDGEFPEGSMGPKIEAAIDFLEGGGEMVVITLPESLPAALEGKVGTRITL